MEKEKPDSEERIDPRSPTWNRGLQDGIDGKDRAEPGNPNYCDGHETGDAERWLSWREGYEDGWNELPSEHPDDPNYSRGHAEGAEDKAEGCEPALKHLREIQNF